MKNAPKSKNLRQNQRQNQRLKIGVNIFSATPPSGLPFLRIWEATYYCFAVIILWSSADDTGSEREAKGGAMNRISNKQLGKIRISL